MPAGSGDLDDQKTIDASCMRLPAGIESLASLTPGEHEALFGRARHQMWGMRSRLAHGSLLVGPSIVHATPSATCSG